MKTSRLSDFPNGIRLSLSGPPNQSAAVMLRFAMATKNDYAYMAFLNSNETVEISREELLATFDAQLNMFVMDYVDPRVMDESALLNAMEAFTRFNAFLKYPKDFRNRVLEILQGNIDFDRFQIIVDRLM